MTVRTCPGCGLELPTVDGPTIHDVATGDTAPETYARGVLAAWEKTEGAQIEAWASQTLESLYG
jgi:hypothetical protein